MLVVSTHRPSKHGQVTIFHDTSWNSIKEQAFPQRLIQSLWRYTISKIREHIYRPDIQVTCGPLFQIKLHLLSNVLLSIFQGPRQFVIQWVRQYLVNFTGLVGIVNAIVYKNEPISTGLGYGQIVLILNTILLQISINIGYDLLSDGAKQIRESKLLFYWWDLVACTSIQIQLPGIVQYICHTHTHIYIINSKSTP